MNNERMEIILTWNPKKMDFDKQINVIKLVNINHCNEYDLKEIYND